MKRLFTILPLGAFFILLASCSSGRADDEPSDNAERKGSPTPVMVTTTPATTKTFYHELLCNGVVEADRMAKITFEAQGIIELLPIANGQMVQKGQLLAQLNNKEQQMALEHAKNALQRAKVEMRHLMLGYTDTSNLSAQILETARIKSGLSEAELSVKEQEYRLSKTSIYAPFAGRVVNLKAKPHNPTTSYEYFCQIVDEHSLQVSFSVLESELQMATEGAQLEVYPFSNPNIRIKGKITEVNRMVDKNGMVTVVAELKQADKNIIPGMNVRVLVRRALPNQLVIPVEGLARRQNRDVVFVMHDSLAYWQYVTIGPRNTTEVVITEGLKEGDKAIVTGNATIGHEAWVKEK
ncbi:MAG: efflux RND transporter periplasmic adaptor subunit [Bacteroidales bacterium]|jgi:RND family efflux transporter MFP subunit|nr:efflux RND transporter periplasmic adaptor subunit [Bacteroidales bacterium]MDY0198160.1 efflux RND transporter periplasmic adaptor subunit [Tenuifilaceae bacterium]